MNKLLVIFCFFMLFSFAVCEETINTSIDSSTVSDFWDGLDSEFNSNETVSNPLPDNAIPFAKLLKIYDENLTLEGFYICLALCLVVFFVLLMIFSDIQIISNKILQFIAVLCLFLLSILSGGLNFAFNYITKGLPATIKTFTSLRFITIVGVLILCIIIFKVILPKIKLKDKQNDRKEKIMRDVSQEQIEEAQRKIKQI